MGAILLVVWIPLWIFFASWAYEKDERILGPGVIATGLGVGLFRNPLPGSDGLVYPLVALLVLVFGIVVSVGAGINRYATKRSNDHPPDM